MRMNIMLMRMGERWRLTSKLRDDLVPIIEALSTRDAVWELTSGAPGTAVTLFSGHSLNALALTSAAVTLHGCRTIPIAVASCGKISQTELRETV